MADDEFADGPIENQPSDAHPCTGEGADPVDGATWQCDECGRNWMVTMVDDEGAHLAPLPMHPDETGLPLIIVC